MMGIFRNRPSVSLGDSFSDSAPGRHSWYGDAYGVPVGVGRQNAADEGSYFVGMNAVLGTAIAGHVAPAIADNDDLPTKPLLHIYNSGQRNIILDYVKLGMLVVNASSTSTNFVAFVDNAGQSSRDSGGTAIVPKSTHSGAPSATGASVYFGAVVSTVGAAAKVGQWTVRPVIAVTEDQYMFKFGGEMGLNAHGVITGTTVASVLVSCAPVIVAPGGNFHLCEANPSGAATAATYEFEFGYIER